MFSQVDQEDRDQRYNQTSTGPYVIHFHLDLEPFGVSDEATYTPSVHY